MEHRSNHDPTPDGRPTITTAAAMRIGHPAGSTRDRLVDDPAPPCAERGVERLAAESGSLVTEYGLLAIVAATLAGAVISWASNGALVTLFNALLRQARALVGA